MTDLPIACSLDSADLARRQEALRTGVLSRAVVVEPLEDGVRWRFTHTDTLLAELGTMLDAERRCCRFLRITVQAEPDLGTATLEVTGPPGTREILAGWLP